MSGKANFKVDPRLASLLGETYRSTEHAVKELVDNSWDADAPTILITLPDPMTANPIVIEDTGTGMTEQELRNEYLVVANDRRSRKGDRTKQLKRLVKGRKGIGKFAGLMVANIMEIETTARGKTTRVIIAKDDLLNAAHDLERIDLPLTVTPAAAGVSGTKVTLSGLSDRYEFPLPERLKTLLMTEYGREEDVRINVNGEPLGLEDLPGDHFQKDETIADAGIVRLNFKVSDGTNPATLEKNVHSVIERNLWVLGYDHSLIASNKTLARTMEEYTATKFTGERATKRPDLFLAQNLRGGFLLIEFKRPAKEIDRQDQRQAQEYRDDLEPKFGQIEILLLGKGRDITATVQNDPPRTEVEHLFDRRFAQLNLGPLLGILRHDLTPIRELTVNLLHNAFPARCGEFDPTRTTLLRLDRQIAFTGQKPGPLQKLLPGEVDGLLEVELEGVGGKETVAIGADDAVALRFLDVEIRTLNHIPGLIGGACFEGLTQTFTEVVRHFDRNISDLWGGRELIRCQCSHRLLQT